MWGVTVLCVLYNVTSAEDPWYDLIYGKAFFEKSEIVMLYFMKLQM